jgi:hypothetical protein
MARQVLSRWIATRAALSFRYANIACREISIALLPENPLGFEASTGSNRSEATAARVGRPK